MLEQLRTLDLSNNHFRGNIPEGLYLCKSLIAVRLTNNQLEGQISLDMLTLQSLSYIALSNNRLTNMTGAINILRGCKNLRVVILAKNFFGEMLPDDKHILGINNFKKLKVLALGGCSVRGQLPRWIAEITELEILDLSYNRISGSIPGWLGTLPKLFYINLSINLLSGKFPQELCTLPALTSEPIALQVNQNYLELPIFVQPTGRTNLAYVRLSLMPPTIYLGNNSLNGDIPTTIGQLKFLHVLDLSNNNFSGIIPHQISYLRNLEKLDLSCNDLSGQIPVSLRSLYFLSSFSVAHNALEGMIPSGTQLQGFPDSSYEGNPGLCGFVHQRKCLPVTRRDVQGENGLQIPRLYVPAGLGYATGFVAVCTTLLFHSPWRHAYFSALIHLKDNVYVIIAVNMARLQRRR